MELLTRTPGERLFFFLSRITEDSDDFRRLCEDLVAYPVKQILTLHHPDRDGLELRTYRQIGPRYFPHRSAASVMPRKEIREMCQARDIWPPSLDVTQIADRVSPRYPRFALPNLPSRPFYREWNLLVCAVLHLHAMEAAIRRCAADPSIPVYFTNRFVRSDGLLPGGNRAFDYLGVKAERDANKQRKHWFIYLPELLTTPMSGYRAHRLLKGLLMPPLRAYCGDVEP